MLELENAREHEVDSNLSNRRDSREKTNFNLRDNIVRVEKNIFFSVYSFFPDILPYVKFDACDVFCWQLCQSEPINHCVKKTSRKKRAKKRANKRVDDRMGKSNYCIMDEQKRLKIAFSRVCLAVLALVDFNSNTIIFSEWFRYFYDNTENHSLLKWSLSLFRRFISDYVDCVHQQNIIFPKVEFM